MKILLYSTLRSVVLGGLGASGALIKIENSSYLTNYVPEDGIKLSPGFYTSMFR